MGTPVLIIGSSGSGKSASLRNFKEDELLVINVSGKPLPFRNKLNVFMSDKYDVITTKLKAATQKAIVIDDCQYLMANEFMRRAKETGYQKFTDIGRNYWELIQTVIHELPPDTIVYFLGHSEKDQDGNEKFKTIGKMLDEKITIEGMYTIVLKAGSKDGQYFFTTQTNGADTAKSPMGMFEPIIPNDLKIIDVLIRDYYSGEEPEKCEECSKDIKPTKTQSIADIISGTKAKTGRQLCPKCYKGWLKQHETEGVPNQTDQ